jgi:RNA polymerase sigma factor for flagellar operon FliA
MSLESAAINRYLPLVRIIATRVCARLPRNYDLDDLIGAGVLGLLDAGKQFDADRGIPFERYAEIRIRGAILDELRATDPTSRLSRRRSSELATVVRGLASSLGHEPSPDEVAATLGIPTDRYLELVARIRPVIVVGFADLTPPGVDDLGDHARHWIDRDAPDPVAHTRLRELGTRLGQAVERLTPRQRQVVIFHYIEDMAFREIAAFLEVTEGRISQLHTASMARLKVLLADQGTDAPA